MHNVRASSQFYLGQHEDYSLGDSISDSLRNCSKEAAGKVSVMNDFSEGGVYSQALTLAKTGC